MARPLRIALFAASLATLIGVAPAAAEGFARIAIGPTGPAAPLPVGETFILHGPVADDVVEVQPVVVRTAWAAFGGAFAPKWTQAAGACARVAAALDPGDLRTGADGLPVGQQGVVDINSLWRPPTARPGIPGDDLPGRQRDYATLVEWQNAFVPAPWRAPAGPNRTFEVRVEADRFFRPGASYCLLMLERRANAIEDNRTVRRELVCGVEQCAGLGNVRRAMAAAKAVTACRTEARDRVMTALSQLERRPDEASPERCVKPTGSTRLDAEQRRAIAAALDAGLLDATMDMRWAALTLPIALVELSGGLSWHPGPVIAADSPFGRFVLTALGAADHVRLQPDGAWTTIDGALTVEQVALRRDGDVVVLSGGGASVRLEAQASAVQLPSSAVTLRDVILLAGGQIAVADEVVTLEQLGQRMLDGPFSLDTDGPAPDPSGEAERVAAVLGGVADAVARAAARGDGRPAGGASGWVDAQLGAWAETAYPAATRAQLDVAAEAARTFVSARTVWSEGISAVDFTLREVLVAGGATIHERAQLDTNTWFAHYVVPTLGLAWLERDGFAQSYVGFEFFGWANRADEPMWSNGWADWRRLLAVELGFALGARGLGPEGRIDGPVGALPPVFVGVAAHVLPYGSVSVGQALLRRRRTGLPGERGPVAGRLYVGASLQINLVQLFGGPLEAQGVMR